MRTKRPWVTLVIGVDEESPSCNNLSITVSYKVGQYFKKLPLIL